MSLENIWRSWFIFKQGKNFTAELHTFQYHLEKNLYNLFHELNSGQYRHGGYRTFVVCDNKRREISVSNIRDRIVHRIIYDYLNNIYDKTFIYDAWSCRLGKGLLGAIQRIQTFLQKYPNSFIWKADVKKFFDSVDHATLLKILSRRVKDKITTKLLRNVINSFTATKEQKIGMPIGNLTSQIFANIYLNELDRYVTYQLKPKAYVRYGDDFILIENDPGKLKSYRIATITCLKGRLKLDMNIKNDKMMRAKQGLKFLGVKLWPYNRHLNKRSLLRSKEKLYYNNIPSYSGLIRNHGNYKQLRHFNWLIYEKLLMAFTEE